MEGIEKIKELENKYLKETDVRNLPRIFQQFHSDQRRHLLPGHRDARLDGP